MDEQSIKMDRITDDELVVGVLAGKPVFQEALYRRFQTNMFRVCLRFARDHAEAEDMLQEGFVRVFKDLGQFRREGPLGGWIRRIMVNTALSHLRKQKHFMSSIGDFEPFEQVASGEVDIVSKLEAERLTAVLQKLPPGYRTVFNLYAIDGFSHEEIAEQLGITIGTSKSQLFKAREYLKRLLDKIYIS